MNVVVSLKLRNKFTTIW